MTAIREPAVAGMFYPADPRQLEADLGGYLAEASVPSAPVPKAIIAPHAGYIYSGPVAASVYARLAPARGTIRRVVLLGPCHRVAVRGMALSGADVFSTPLGPIPVDHEAEALVADLPGVGVSAAAHRDEHSLEVHLPFLQRVLGSFKLVPIAVGWAEPADVARALDRLWGGPETLIVISSDLSHYLDYGTARAIDDRTRAAIEGMNIEAISEDQACGRVPIKGLLLLARKRGLAVETVDVRNSGDTMGDKSRVVGYGSWAFYEAEDPFEAETKAMLERHGTALLQMAAASIEHGLARGRPLPVDPRTQPEALRQPGACFVTLKKNGELRGCIGSVEAHRPLVEDVADNAYNAAFRDHRFLPVAAGELADLDLSISVLGQPRPMTFADEAHLLAQLRPGIDGLIIEDRGARALFLPQVWAQLPAPEAFLSHLKRKAGLDPAHWSPTFRAWRFIAVGIGKDALDDPGALWQGLGH